MCCFFTHFFRSHRFTTAYHLHGNEFQIVARGSGTLDAAEAASIDYNTTNPLRRDTLVIPGGEYAVLRISNDNPGVWVLHCHIA